MNWRGKPLRSYRTVVQLIAATRTDTGLTVRAELDENKYPKGVKVFIISRCDKKDSRVGPETQFRQMSIKRRHQLQVLFMYKP